MENSNKAVEAISTQELTSTNEIMLPVDTTSLNKESLDLINKLIAEQNPEKTKDLTYLFNINQNKKTMVRQNKLNDLLDALTDQAILRITTRPDEISQEQLLAGLKTVQDMIDKGQKQVNGVAEAPLIQINQQSNDINIGNDVQSMPRESRERVKNAVLGMLNSLNAQQAASAPDVELTEKDVSNHD